MKRFFRKYILRMLPLLLVAVMALPAEAIPVPDPDPAPAVKSSSRKKKKRRYSSSRRKTSRSRNSRRYYSGRGAGVAPTFSTSPTPGSVGSAASAPRTLTPEQEEARKKRKITVEKPDLDAIRQATLDPKSQFYFPKLLAKYNRNDTTMTQEEYRNFYLGYIFQEDYDPYRTSPYSGVTDELRRKTSHSKEEIDTIKKYAELTLRDNPFDLRQMSFLVHVLKERRKDMSAKIWEYRLEHLLGAIKSTGTGEDEENAFYVIYPMHEYDLIQLMGYEATDVDFIEPGYDYLSVRPDDATAKRLRDKAAKGFYFNVDFLTRQYEKKHPQAPEEETLIITEDADKGTDPDDIPAE